MRLLGVATKLAATSSRKDASVASQPILRLNKPFSRLSPEKMTSKRLTGFVLICSSYFGRSAPAEQEGLQFLTFDFKTEGRLASSDNSPDIC